MNQKKTAVVLDPAPAGTYSCQNGKGKVTIATGACTNRYLAKKTHMCTDGHPCARPEEIAKSAK